MADDSKARFSFYARMVGCGIQRAHHYKDKDHQGGHGEGRYVPELHVVLDVNRGDGYDNDRMRGALNLYTLEPEVVQQLAALWWGRGLKTFDHGPRSHLWALDDPGRVRFRITIEQVDD